MKTLTNLSSVKPVPTNINKLLSKFDKININYESRISADDLTFCKKTQQIYIKLKEHLNLLLEHFESIYKKAQINDVFKQEERQGKFSVTTRHKNNPPWDQKLRFSALYPIVAIKNNITKAKKQFVIQIRNYFQDQYNINLDLSELESTDQELNYILVLEKIFKETKGTDLLETGIQKLKDEFTKCLRYENVRKSKKIVFHDLAVYEYPHDKITIHYNCTKLQKLVLALSYFERESTSIISELTNVMPYKYYQGPDIIFETVNIDGLNSITKFRFYKNCNVVIEFKTSELADQFWHMFNMDSKIKRD